MLSTLHILAHFVFSYNATPITLMRKLRSEDLNDLMNWEGIEHMLTHSVLPVPTKANSELRPGKGFKLIAKTNTEQTLETYLPV